MSIRRICQSLVLAAGACMAAACGPTEPVVGVLIPETGRGASYGAFIKEGMEVAKDEVNAAGGVGGLPLRLAYADTATDPDTGVAAAQGLLDNDSPVAIIGAVNSSVTAKVHDEVTLPNRIVLMSPASSAPALTRRSNYFVRVYPPDTLEGGRMADFIADDLRLKTLVLISVADEYGAGYKKGLVERYRGKKNRTVPKIFNYMPDETDFGAIVEEVKTIAPQAIFIAGYEDKIAEVATALRAGGVTQPLFCSGSVTEKFPALAGAAGEGMVFSRPDFRRIGNPDKVAAFIAAFKAKHGREPEDYAAYAYDAVKMMAQVMGDGDLSRDGMLIAIRRQDQLYHGVTGDIVFGNDSDVVASPTKFIIHEGAALHYEDYIDQGGTPPGAEGGAD